MGVGNVSPLTGFLDRLCPRCQNPAHELPPRTPAKIIPQTGAHASDFYPLDASLIYMPQADLSNCAQRPFTVKSMSAPIKVLFVCGRNRRRSPTAERIFRDDPRMSVRSAGTSDSSKRKITENDLAWADLILVMEPKYAARIRSLFPTVPPMRSLDIPDDYEYMDPELTELLETAVDHELAETHE